MASERLTISDKDRIARSIIKPIIEQARKESEKFGKFADEYPNTVNIREEIYLSSLTNERFRHLKTYVEVNYFVYQLITNEKFNELKNSTETKIFVQKMVELEKKASSIMNRTKCALEDINTTKQLKDNFPEAYNILMGFPKENVKGNKCDDIEKLRAELSKL